MTRSGWLWLSAAVAAATTFAPGLGAWDATGAGDWPQFHHLWEASRLAIQRGEWPLWDPYHCGGVTLWGQPQSMHAAPTWWITGLLFGTAPGSKLFVILHATIGLAGAYALARASRSAAAATLTAAMFGLGGFFAWRVAEGHAGLLPLHYLPWALIAGRRAATDARGAVLLALVLALQIAEGGVYALPFTGLAVLVDGLVLAATRPDTAARRARGLALAGVLFVLVGAARLWPIALTAARVPRPTAAGDGQTLAELGRALSLAAAPELWPHAYGWAELGAFVGVGGLALALVGVTAARRRSTWPALAGVVVFGALALGDHGPASPWRLLHALPGFSQLQLPSRFAGVLGLHLALLAGAGLDRVADLVVGAGGPRAARLVRWPLAIAVALEVAGAARPVAAVWRGPPIAGRPAARHHLVVEPDYLARFMSYPRRNVGTPSCYDPLPWEVPEALWEGDQPQAQVVEGAATITDETRTGATRTMTVRAASRTRVVVNQRFDPGWRASAGRIVNDAGRLGIALGPGEHRLSLRYAPRDLPWSVGLSLVGLAACLVTWRRARRLKRAGSTGKAGPP